MRWERPPVVRTETAEIIEKCKADLAASVRLHAGVEELIQQTKARIADSNKLLSRIDAELRRSPLKP